MQQKSTETKNMDALKSELKTELKGDLVYELGEFRKDLLSTRDQVVNLHTTLNLQIPIIKELRNDVQEIITWKKVMEATDERDEDSGSKKLDIIMANTQPKSNDSTVKRVAENAVKNWAFWIFMSVLLVMLGAEGFINLVKKVVL